jgi:hypothetical protein
VEKEIERNKGIAVYQSDSWWKQLKTATGNSIRNYKSEALYKRKSIIDNQLAEFKRKHYSEAYASNCNEIHNLIYEIYKNDVYGLGKAVFSASVVIDGEYDYEYNEEGLMSGTSLTILFKSADVRMDTRGLEDLDDNGTVSELEEVIDGRRIYRLAVFLVRDGAEVESVVLEDGDARMANGNTEATVSFDNLDYSKPYQLYAVANYGDYGTQASGHLSSVTDVTGSMQVASSASAPAAASK